MAENGVIRQYLSLGFVPDAELASKYVQELLGRRSKFERDPIKLLTEIMAELTAGYSDIAIPVTAGQDSRALLGAALRIFPADRIHCFTFGLAATLDVTGARAACRRVGVAHQVLDSDTIQWDLNHLVQAMKRQLREYRATPPIDGLAVFSAFAATIPDELPVLSGYLGGVVNGHNLPRGVLAYDDDRDQVLSRFYAHNRAVLDDQPDSMFREFLAAHEHLQQDWKGLTKFDLLDIGFRQRCRIRPSVSTAFRQVIRPFEDNRWVTHWYSQSRAYRVDHKRYETILSRGYPRVFPGPSASQRIRRWLSRRIGGGKKQHPPVDAGWTPRRGDPRGNASMAAVFEETCRSFDRRGVCADGAAMQAFESFMREPTRGSFRQARWFASAEVLARAEEELARP